MPHDESSNILGLGTSMASSAGLGGIGGAGAAGAAGGMGASFLGFLGTPGVGTALMAGATLLAGLFGSKKKAEQEQFATEVKRQQEELNRAMTRTAQSQREIGSSFQTSIGAEGQIHKNTLDALRGFYS